MSPRTPGTARPDEHTKHPTVELLRAATRFALAVALVACLALATVAVGVTALVRADTVPAQEDHGADDGASRRQDGERRKHRRVRERDDRAADPDRPRREKPREDERDRREPDRERREEHRRAGGDEPDRRPEHTPTEEHTGRGREHPAGLEEREGRTPAGVSQARDAIADVDPAPEPTITPEPTVTPQPEPAAVPHPATTAQPEPATTAQPEPSAPDLDTWLQTEVGPDIQAYLGSTLPAPYALPLTPVAPVGGLAAGTDTTSCAPSQLEAAVFCPADGTAGHPGTVVYDPGAMALIAAGHGGEAGAALALARAFGHAAQAGVPADAAPHDPHATADCLAGAWAAHAEREGLLSSPDVEAAARTSAGERFFEGRQAATAAACVPPAA